jgi:hypothetical protein
MAKKAKKLQSATALLDDFVWQRVSFLNLSKILESFQTKEFKSLTILKQFDLINRQLLNLILEAPKESFLLPAVIEFIGDVNKKKCIKEVYTLSLFEFWLNHFSGLDDHKNHEVRSKIAGKHIPREDYQVFFPIGMNKSYSGPHFVTAHLSPDIDTMMASFWGWIDAFAARVGSGRHLWCLPGGPPDSPVINIFQDFFGQEVFSVVARQEKNLTISALDLIHKELVTSIDDKEQIVDLWSEAEDIRNKMKHEKLTVVIHDDHKNVFPLGTISAKALNNPVLGTVSFRDFCNLEEVKMASYLTPISIVDHHKVSLKTGAPPLVIIGDAQSCNVLMAEIMFGINSRYSLGGMSADQINDEMQELKKAPVTVSNIRLLQKLAQRQLALNTCKDYFIHPQREIAEYVCFLHAILDDTDLLTKVSKRDVDCVVELLNRIKSLIVGHEVEIINLDAIPHDKNYAKAAAKMILQHPEMYSFYKKVYEVKEKEVEKNLQASQEEHFTFLFLDTKEQNGCCRVGQTKIFSINLQSFQTNTDEIVSNWIKKAKKIHQANPEIDLHLHMVSTIASAADVFKGTVGKYDHLDELWLWVPSTEKAYSHLASFLTAFEAAHKLGHRASIEFLKKCPEEVLQIVAESCPLIPQKKVLNGLDLPVVVLRYPAGMMNSRKSMITPFLPKIV